MRPRGSSRCWPGLDRRHLREPDTRIELGCRWYRSHMAEAPERAPADAARFREALILSGLLSIALVLFYAVLFPIEGIRVPAWSDAQTYIWWVRRAAVLGLSAFGTGTRPVTVSLIATLSTLVHVPAEAIVEVIGIVLAAALGLAAAALSESILGPH